MYCYNKHKKIFPLLDRCQPARSIQERPSGCYTGCVHTSFLLVVFLFFLCWRCLRFILFIYLLLLLLFFFFFRRRRRRHRRLESVIIRSSRCCLESVRSFFVFCCCLLGSWYSTYSWRFGGNSYRKECVDNIILSYYYTNVPAGYYCCSCWTLMK